VAAPFVLSMRIAFYAIYTIASLARAPSSCAVVAALGRRPHRPHAIAPPPAQNRRRAP
tara:strand:+ start:437 stop:610 length:174 start_codon:yes stop_codon:yes gene_type:complete